MNSIARRSSFANVHLSQNSTVSWLVFVRLRLVVAQPLDPSKRAAVLVSAAGPPGTPSVTPPCAVAGLPPTLSAKVVPLLSPRRQ